MKLSIITICNASTSVNDVMLTINSVKNQNYRDIEHLIFDCSNNVINNIPVDSLNLNIFNNVLSYDNYFNNLNYCLNKTNGELIIILDPGYFLKHSDAISKIINYLYEADLDFAYCDMVFVDNFKNEVSIIFGICNNFIFLNSWIPPFSVIFFRKRVLNKLLMFDNKYNFINSFDFIFNIFNISKFKVLYIPDQLIMRSVALSSKNKFIKICRISNVLKIIFKYKITRKEILFKLFTNRFKVP